MDYNPVIERDPEINRLTTACFEQMSDIIKQECPTQPLMNENNIRFVSFEEAWKELLTTNS